MSNTFLNPDHVTKVAAELARADMHLSKLIHTDVSAEFKPGSGDTVHVAVPGVTTTSTRAVGSAENYVLGSITEQSIPVELAVEAYSAVPLTLADNSLEIADYAKQVLRPQALTVANHCDQAVADAFAASTPDASIIYDAVSPRKAVIAARAKLRAQGVSAERPLTVLMGADVYADALAANEIDDQGRIAGLTAVESTRIPADALHVFVREAFVLAMVAPELPAGAPFGGTVVLDEPDAGRISLRYMRTLNGANGVEISTVSTFIGAKAMPLPVANYETGEVDMVAGGGIVTVDTTPAAA